MALQTNKELLFKYEYDFDVSGGAVGNINLVSKSVNPLEILEIPTPDDLYATIIHPQIEIKTSEEACTLDLAPTSSTTSAMAFGDALAVTLLQAKGFTKDDFAKSHPAGKLGKALTLLVSDVMHSGLDMPKVTSQALLSDALLEITEKGLGMTLVEENNKIVGIFTDGDLRRCIGDMVDINQTLIKDVMTLNFKSIQSSDLAIDAAKVMEDNKIFTLVVFKSGKAIGVLSMHDLLQSGIV